MEQNTTSSIAFPYMIDVARSHVSVVNGNASVVNRTRLLMLTEPTELYNEPTFGVGLKKYLWQYNTANVRAMMQDRIKDQLRIHEPCVDSDNTSFADGLIFTGQDDTLRDKLQTLKMTVGLQTIFQDRLNLTIDLDSERARMFN